MAKKRGANQNSTDVKAQGFTKHLVEDTSNYAVDDNQWTQARNAINNSKTGDLGMIGNEPSNKFCFEIMDGLDKLTIIGAIHVHGDLWVIFSTNDSKHEIGVFKEDLCQYTKIVNDVCLNFDRAHLIIGISKAAFDCTYNIYWSDANNPDRTISIDIDTLSNNPYTNPESPIPWIQTCVDDNGCITCTNTPVLDCNKIRLEALVKQPCLRVERGSIGGLIPNGSYYVVIGYTINNQRVTDFSMPSNIQPLFAHANTSSSLDIYIDTIDSSTYDEFELVLVQFFNGQTVASNVGIYSTRQTKITLDYLDSTWPAEPLNLVYLRNNIVDKSDGIYEIGQYAVRVGPTDKFDFNYQPLANQIVTKWVNVEYPEDYYRQGGNHTGYLRDEVYAFFIRWIYNTGDKSASYHIPGRPHYPSDIAPISPGDVPNALPEIQAGIPLGSIYNWMVNNTATSFSPAGIVLTGSGTIVGAGYMGYWESEEFYNDIVPAVWNASAHCWSSLTPWTIPCPGVPAPIIPYPGTTAAQYDLCGAPIRHHRFPDNATDPNALTLAANHFGPGGNTIRIMGVNFDNIRPPVNNDGTPIDNIVGYEILRGSRVGQESIIAKGMVNNMFEYTVVPDDDDTNINLLTARQGLYPNYPYNDLHEDYFISKKPTSWEPDAGNSGPIYPGIPGLNYIDFLPNDKYSKNFFTFHSPDTQFTDPYLSATEIKIYGELSGSTEGAFSYVDKHPKHQFVTDAAFAVAMMVGAGIAALAINPKRSTTQARARNMKEAGWTSVGSNNDVYTLTASGTSSNTANTNERKLFNRYNQGLKIWSVLDSISGTSAGLNGYTLVARTAATLSSRGAGVLGPEYQYDEEASAVSSLPVWMAVITGVTTFYNYFVEGTNATLRLIKAYSKYNQFAAQYNSHCKYTTFTPPWNSAITVPSIEVNKRTVINTSRYLEPQIQDFGATHRINNLFRGKAVALETVYKLRDPFIVDDSRVTIGQAPIPGSIPDKFKKFKTPFNTKASSHYVALKQRIRNQYGQIEQIRQVPVSTCWYKSVDKDTNVLFNGDTYVGRYSEKNTMFYFYNWLYNQPNGAEFNYKLNKMLPYSAFWMDTDEFDWSDFINSISAAFANPTNFLNTIVTPSDKHCFDRPGITNTGFFTLKNCFQYLFNSGIRDFFVESNCNVDFRDWGEPLFERHYDPYSYTDYIALFSSDIIKSGNFFKYDFSLSINKLFNNYISWGETHTRDYNPTLAQYCYTYSPNRLMYSLPQPDEEKKDFWRVFLPLNAKNFRSKVIAIKRINLNGAIILFEDSSPIQILGTEQLTLEAGTKVTIGDGGLFNQPLQYLDNSDRPYEYGSCQNRLSITATPVGIFYMSQNQGKIFASSGSGIQEISLPGSLKWWLAQYLPYVLTDDFPNFSLIDNPVIGIGCHSVYDNQNMLMYFCKKDYQLRKDIPYTLTYEEGANIFIVDQTGLKIELGDPSFFSDASWTISYDPKVGQWISYHDWHPTYLIAGKNTFMSVLDNSVWLHNDVCDSYCNYYGVDYPFEIEFQTDTIQQINTIRSIEYQLECYIYADNCYDRFHNLDFNFDEAIIYNSEQTSGLLKLNLSPKNNPPLLLQYPIINLDSIDIIFSKEENKYRFSQFWDITKDRGEFPIGSDYPPTGPLIPGTTILAGPHTAETIFLTEPNGYVKNLNVANMNYNKYQTERKKFRHYRNVVFLRRKVSGNIKMLFDIANVKNLNSPR